MSIYRERVINRKSKVVSIKVINVLTIFLCCLCWSASKYFFPTSVNFNGWNSNFERPYQKHTHQWINITKNWQSTCWYFYMEFVSPPGKENSIQNLCFHPDRPLDISVVNHLHGKSGWNGTLVMVQDFPGVLLPQARVSQGWGESTNKSKWRLNVEV